jgi:two-component system, OmpR family, response regulator MtrA
MPRRPRQDSNLRTRLRRPALYPLSYGGERSECSNGSFRGRRRERRYARSVPHVLLVDDDPVILRLLEVNFRLEGFETTTSSRGDEALGAAQEHAPDAIVLDVMLPGMDGHEIFRRLREEPALSDVPVIFLSARSRDETVEGVQDPRLRYLTKPFDTSELVQTVRTLIEEAP